MLSCRACRSLLKCTNLNSMANKIDLTFGFDSVTMRRVVAVSLSHCRLSLVMSTSYTPQSTHKKPMMFSLSIPQNHNFSVSILAHNK